MNTPSPERFTNERVDRIGAFASSLCAVHCAVCALLPAAFAALGLSMLLSPAAEWGFTLIAIVFAAGALVMGWRVHRSPVVFALLSLGIVGLLASRFMEMGSDHHGHHEDSHHEVAHAEGAEHQERSENKHHKTTEGDEHKEGEGKHTPDEDSKSAHHDEHADEHDAMHLAGSGVGVLAGLLLLFGHITNIRSTRACRKECCS